MAILKKVLITGGNGYIAKSLAKGLKDCTIETVTRQDVNLLDQKACKDYFNNKVYDVVIHTAIEGGNRLQSETSSVIDNNFIMYHNVYKYAAQHAKFISFGSGAEIGLPTTWYGISKLAIRYSMLDKPNCYNLRIFAVFDENELDRRFIKGNLQRYATEQDLIIHQNKRMDFFYMEDLRTLIEHYIHTDNVPKEIDCCYKEKYTLNDIASIINRLGKNRLAISTLQPGLAEDYIGTFTDLGLSYRGLYDGIINSYHNLI